MKTTVLTATCVAVFLSVTHGHFGGMGHGGMGHGGWGHGGPGGPGYGGHGGYMGGGPGGPGHGGPEHWHGGPGHGGPGGPWHGGHGGHGHGGSEHWHGGHGGPEHEGAVEEVEGGSNGGGEETSTTTEELVIGGGGQGHVWHSGGMTITEETTTTTTTTIKKSYTIYVPVELQSYTWAHSIMVSKHSVAAPQKFHHKNTVVRESMFNRGSGCTTSKGLKWAYATGTVYRKSFSKLIQDFNSQRLWARCSTHRSSTESTTSLLSAMFPPDEDAPTNPIPLESVPHGHDKFTATFGRDIPVDWSSTYEITGVPGSRFNNIGAFMSFIRQQFDISDLDDHTVHQEFLKPIVAARYEGIEMPQWVTDHFDAIEWVTTRLTQHDTPYGKTIYPLYGRLLAKYLADRLDSITSGSSTENVESAMSMLSYSDINIQALAHALNPNFGVWRPGYMGGLTMNVFRHPENTNDVKISISFTNGLVPKDGDYNSMAIEGFGLFKIPGCGGSGEYCSITEFTRILRQSYQTEFDETQVSCIGETAMV